MTVKFMNGIEYFALFIDASQVKDPLMVLNRNRMAPV